MRGQPSPKFKTMLYFEFEGKLKNILKKKLYQVENKFFFSCRFNASVAELFIKREILAEFISLRLPLKMSSKSS